MKPEEAIEILGEVKELDDSIYAYSPAYMDAINIAIEALKEVQQYREIGSVGEIKQAIGVLSLSENDIIKTFHELNEYRKIGTVEECREAVEKQNPKKCVNDFCPDHTHYKCPSCGKIQKTKYGNSEFGCMLNYCSNCGQAIDENLEGMEDEKIKSW